MSNRNVWYYVGGVGLLVIVMVILWRSCAIAPQAPSGPYNGVAPVPSPHIEKLPATPPASTQPPQESNEQEKRTDEIAERQEDTGEPNGREEYAEDGNNVLDMEIGDVGATGLKAFSVPKKNNPTKGTQASLIAYGKKYIGRPYVYGSNRNDDSSFDCSDFTRWVYLHARGMNIGADSRTQKTYTQTNGQHRWGRLNWRKSSPGDLFFMTSYKGTSKSLYSGVNANSPITHVAIYLGNGQILHTASAPTGVRIQNIENTHLQWRIVYIGRPYRG